MTSIPLVLLLGTLSTIQTHLAKALERQGIEVFEQIKARLQKSSQPAAGGLKKPLIYLVGVPLNNTLFVWSTLAQPFGPPALFSSMFGVGLVFLMVYAATALKEMITPREVAGLRPSCSASWRSATSTSPAPIRWTASRWTCRPSSSPWASGWRSAWPSRWPPADSFTT